MIIGSEVPGFRSSEVLHEPRNRGTTEPRNLQAPISLSSPSLKTLRVFVITEKTTVCRIFSCQRSVGELRSAEPLNALTRSALRRLTPFARGARYSLAPTPFARSLAQRFDASLRSRAAESTHSTQQTLCRSRSCVTATTLKTSQPDQAGLPSRSCERSDRLAKVGGEYRARTGDLLVANQALSQLS